MLSRSKAVLVIATAVSFMLPLMIGTPTALGGEKEKISGRNVFVATDIHPAEVPDVEGHVINLVRAKGMVFRDDGEVAAGVLIGTSDYTNGIGLHQGYTHWIYADGSTTTASYKGEAIGEGKSEGTWTYVKGTGRFEGIKGSGTYKSRGIAPGQWYSDWEGERTLP